MAEPDTLIAFFLATAIFAVTPGPGWLYLAAQTMTHGPRAGLYSSLAFYLASFVHIGFAAFGVTILLASAPHVLIALKLAGGAYLCWMGVAMLRRGAMLQSQPKAQTRRAFRDSLLVEILNPKSAVFYLAFLPQFTSPAASVALWLQVLVLGTVANTIFCLADAICILGARYVAGFVRASHRAKSWARKFSAAVLIGLGVKIIADQS
ncbi:MAG: LysE family translocator [Pseudomonadota bacterium]